MLSKRYGLRLGMGFHQMRCLVLDGSEITSKGYLLEEQGMSYRADSGP